ncbi:hypothetical protein [Mucilaginibacter ginkgonis]|uniref:Uncharacterized protein n=1 Tax=Mucilaginibacter ginkgonis TaxID=2682091 RepID=A0A6I4I3W7_9SPHI|nr:hypothetical protein [Mucilaginibacter ginkgonis]QQL48683.1 hypothetical protein GO620_010880 [Mucilaginibacter ginkgonis]
MKRAFLPALFVLLLFGLRAAAQTYTVPVNYKFSSPADYKRYEPQVLETVDWLQNTPWTEEPVKRRLANAFLFKWIQGVPGIVMTIMPELINLTDKNNLLMAAFVGGYSKYAIEHPGYLKEEANNAAVRALIAKYRAEPTRKKDEDIEKLIRLERDGQLGYWVMNDYEKPQQE